MKSFLKQIKYEIKNIIRSRFLFVISLLLVAAAIAFPIINLVLSKRPQQGYDGRPIPMYSTRAAVNKMIDKPGIPGFPGGEQDSIVIDGVTITADNPFFWNLRSIVDEKQYMENDKDRFTTPEALDLTLAMMDMELQFYLNFAKSITNYADYRVDLAWRGQESAYDKFILEHTDVSEDVLLEALQYRRGIDPEMLRKKYLDLSAEEKLAALDKADEELNALVSIVENNDFPKYVDLRIAQESKTIADLNEQIAIQEQEIIKNPSQEEIINNIILDLKRNIAMIEENTIPILQLRLEKNIIPGTEVWQNSALMDIESNRSQLQYTEILSEEKFNQETWLVQQYKTYAYYVESMQAQIDTMKNSIIIGEKSIEADKPDMKYVYNGSRSRTFRFLNYSIFITLFAVLLGGWLMASEFQQGTIRLLMIRPKTRTKILMAKFTSALVICLVIYGVGSLLNMVTTGLCFGFSDFAFPNYSVAGETGFLAYYLPKMVACTVPIIFSFALAFMLSVIIKNVAVAIAVPIAGFIGSTFVTAALSISPASGWLNYTPFPYIYLSQLFIQGTSPYPIYGMRSTPPDITYGILLLLGLALLSTILAIFVFKKKDIAN